jgi:hypothetical protein
METSSIPAKVLVGMREDLELDTRVFGASGSPLAAIPTILAYIVGNTAHGINEPRHTLNRGTAPYIWCHEFWESTIGNRVISMAHNLRNSRSTSMAGVEPVAGPGKATF